MRKNENMKSSLNLNQILSEKDMFKIKEEIDALRCNIPSTKWKGYSFDENNLLKVNTGVLKNDEFIISVYLSFLGRRPNLDELAKWQALLNTNLRSRNEIITSVFFSVESKSFIRDKGKIPFFRKVSYFFYKIPLIGKIFRFFIFIYRLPKIIYNINVKLIYLSNMIDSLNKKQ